MADQASPMTRRQMEEKIVALAWKDEGFRKRFLADPKKQFEEKLGTKLPADLKMTAHAEDGNHLHFVIPAKPKATVGELTDQDLERVAGGFQIVSARFEEIGGAVTYSAIVATQAAFSQVGSMPKADW